MLKTKKIFFLTFVVFLCLPFSARAESNCYCWYYRDIYMDENDRFCVDAELASIVYCENSCKSIENTEDQIFEGCVFTDSSPTNPTVCLSVPGGERTEKTLCGRYPKIKASAATTTEETGTPFIYPNLNVKIPNLTFSDIVLKDGAISVNFLGEYVAGLYKYLLGIAATFAVIMLMIDGVEYIISPEGKNIGKAKGRITKTLTGVVLLACVYLALYLVNPEFVFFEPLNIQVVPEVQYVDEDAYVIGSMATNFSPISHANIIGPGASKVPKELQEDIKNAASALQGQGVALYMASSVRSFDEQVSIIQGHCANPPFSSLCNPLPGKSTACMLIDRDPANCPHTTGRAFDIWGYQNGSQCIKQSECLKDMAACVTNPCQAAIIKAMRDQGFCVLSSEAWHFEKPGMSTSCH